MSKRKQPDCSLFLVANRPAWIEIMNRVLLICLVASIHFVVWSSNTIGQHAESRPQQATLATESESSNHGPYLLVLGIAQDGGYPQAACRKPCCERARADPAIGRHVVCLAIVDSNTRQRWLIECTPDFPDQLHQLNAIAPPRDKVGIDGILLTHAHIGHYAGLIHLGREVMGADRVPVYAMPLMRRFLRNHGPWNQLVNTKNIEIHEIADGKMWKLNEQISVTPLLVPHRDEYSETVGFVIRGPHRSALFLPDIDKWDRWERKITEVLGEVDVAYLDGTFFADGELPGREMSTIPHPFITESMERFANLPKAERNKVRFLHLNHTNPALDHRSPEAKRVRDAGHNLASEGERFKL
jgi:pyrroloquinoline quinone biosynthesis protein B